MESRPREFSRTEYGRQSSWPDRIRREGPFILNLAREGGGPEVVVDLGCGTGEHARFLVAQGWSVVGLDLSRAALAAAASSAVSGAVWARADLHALPLADASARLALCLGNTLVILGDDGAIGGALREAFRVLAPGGTLLVQILNYKRLRSGNVRHLPLNFRREPTGETVFLRLMDFDEPRHVSFHAIALERRPGEDAVRVTEAVRRRLRSLEHEDLERLLVEAGFAGVRLLGDYGGRPFDPAESQDVIAVARRPGG